MDRIETRHRDAASGPTELVALGFGTTVGMWAIGYVCRLPVVLAPSWLVAVLLVAVPLAGGWCAGRYGVRGWRGGLYTGLIAGLLNLLVLGSFLSGESPNVVRPTALLFVPASVAVMSLLGALGAVAAGTDLDRKRDQVDWTWGFTVIALVATFLLLVAGGLVTSSNSGLAVVDWPNSFGYNMFLYPISRMTGGIYYEHAHRLLGSLVGLTTLALAVVLARFDDRSWVRRLAAVAFVLVCVQGLLGGLRVTGRFTLADQPDLTAPEIRWAVVHGVLGQLFFSVLAVLSAATSPSWRRAGSPRPHASAPTDRALSIVTAALIVVQLSLGALQRHLAAGLTIHVTLAFIVAGCAIATGVRLWGTHGRDERVFRRLGPALVTVTCLQLVLGLGAWVVIGTTASGSGWDVVVTTAHQGVGAVLLATAVAAVAWTRRLVAPLPAAAVAKGAA